MNRICFFTYVTLSLMCHNLIFSQIKNSDESLQKLRLSAVFTDSNSDKTQNVAPNISVQSVNGISEVDYVTVEVDKYTVEELVTKVLSITPSFSFTDFSSSELCGFGYFQRNNSNFPLKDGIIIRSGDAKKTEGKWDFTGDSAILNNFNTRCTFKDENSPGKDLDLEAAMPGTNVKDASFVKFSFVAVGTSFSFNYLFASNEYGNFQCQYFDPFAFLLEDVTPGLPKANVINIATVPGTKNTPVSVLSIRDKKYNTNCSSENLDWFGQFNADPNVVSAIKMMGQTKVMTAQANGLIPGHTYSVKMAIADDKDAAYDATVFVEGGSFQMDFYDPSTLGVSKFDLESVALFPNPANDKVHVQLQNSNEVIDTILIHDLLGNLVQKVSGLSTNQHGISVGSLPKGMYLVQITTESKLKVTKKLMVN